MRSVFLSFLLIMTCLMPLATSAQMLAEPAKDEKVTVSQDDLKGLITTLESETARSDLIKNLKTLQESQGKSDSEKTEETLAPLTETLGVDSFASRLIHAYEDFLVRNHLKGSTVGKIALSTIVTVVMLVLALFLRRSVTRGLYWLDRAVTWLDLPAMRLRLYGRILRGVVTIALGLLLIYAWCLIWEISAVNPFNQDWFTHGLRVSLNVFFVVMLATLAWEAVNAVVHVVFMRIGGKESARASTILPIARNVMFMVFAVLFALVVLSEIGINIMPLLAGAGIVGIAVGFGAQTMVKDFLSGFTLILEDIVRVGDVVRIDQNFSGSVEKITLRKIQLRSGGGTVATIPFSAITVIENLTKDFSAHDFAIGVQIETDPEKVFDVIRSVVEEMQADPEYGPMILEPVDIWGLDSFTDYAMVIKGRIKTQPGKHWKVQREFNRRRRYAFEKAAIPLVLMPKNFQIAQNMNVPGNPSIPDPAHI
ncbi:MAG TPA: mechanosensitive ion channel family protein [Alphaproteobacteria bacterium]